MNFVQIEFLWFFALVFAGYWAAPSVRVQNAILVVASAVFYGWIQPWFVLLLFGSATLDYFVGRGLATYPQHRKKLLALSLGGNLGALWWFKYYDFFIENVALAMEQLGVPIHPLVLGVYLPIGISFYTFQTLSYTIDVYRGVLKPRKDYLNYLTFVTLFPQLVAGPVERASRLLPQVERKRIFDMDNLTSGFGLALLGAFKKLVIADTLAPFVDQVFVLREPAGPLVWAGALAFATQIYGDLSGYTDIARGTARMLGFELSRNFDKPHLAASTPELWRRWHISVSTWFRDYVTVPILAGRTDPSFLRQLVAVFATFMIIGVWHGAGWNFFAFGLWHGAWVMFYLAVSPRVPPRLQTNRFARFGAIAFQMLAVGLPGVVLFREPNPIRAVEMLLTPPWQGTEAQWIAAGAIVLLVFLLYIPLVVQDVLTDKVVPKLVERKRVWPVARGLGWAAMGLGCVLFYRDTARDFIYFQF